MTGLIIAGLAGLATLVLQVTDWLKELTNLPNSWRASLTQAIAWTGGIVGVFLYGASQFASSVSIGGVSLAAMNGPTKVLVGMVVGSVGSTLADYKKSLDGTQSAAVPPLLPPKAPPTP